MIRCHILQNLIWVCPDWLCSFDWALGIYELRDIDRLSRVAALSKLFLVPYLNGSTRKAENLLPVRANSFILEQTSFQKGLCVLESKQDITEFVFCKHLCVWVCVEGGGWGWGGGVGVAGWQLIIDIQWSKRSYLNWRVSCLGAR